MNKSRVIRNLGIGAALLVPALAIAALNIPHAFTTGQVLAATDLNDNFAAVKAEVEALQLRMQAVETTTATLNGVSAPKCQWRYFSPCDPSPGVNCELVCPAGTHPLAGGCDSVFGVAISESFPAVGPGVTFPQPVASPTAYDRWVCQAAGGALQTAYALCCPVGS